MALKKHPFGGYIIPEVVLVGETWKGSRLYSPGTYENGRLAIVLDSDSGERLTTVTVNMPEAVPALGCVLVKTWGENEGLLPQLGEVLHPTGGGVKINPTFSKAEAAEVQVLVPVGDLKGV